MAHGAGWLMYMPKFCNRYRSNVISSSFLSMHTKPLPSICERDAMPPTLDLYQIAGGLAVMYGGSLRLTTCRQLRMQDVDLERQQTIVRQP